MRMSKSGRIGDLRPVSRSFGTLAKVACAMCSSPMSSRLTNHFSGDQSSSAAGVTNTSPCGSYTRTSRSTARE